MNFLRIVENSFSSKYSCAAPTIIRITLCIFFLWKVLSRDFSVLTTAPIEVLNFYPSDQYPLSFGYAALGFKPIVDLFTFHWIHYWIRFPSTTETQIIQFVSAGALILTLFWGRGPLRLFSTVASISIVYLWGYIYRSGAELDGIFIHLQLFIMFALFSGAEGRTLKGNKDTEEEEDQFFSAAVAIVAIGYFIPGLNKIIDISVFDWFRFSLVETASNIADWSDYGFYYETPTSLARLMAPYPQLNYVAVPITYIAELSAPVIFFKRKLIPFFAIFFILFHLTTWTLIAFFYGYFALWIMLTVPYLTYVATRKKAV